MKALFFLLVCCSSLFGLEQFDFFYNGELKNQKIITATKRICLQKFPDAYNPSLFKTKEGFLLSFRYTAERYSQGFVSQIGIVKLNTDFEPISEPQFLDTREGNAIPSQSEDARFFSYNDKLYLIYNDNVDEIWHHPDQRRDMFIAEVKEENGKFVLLKPLKLIHAKKYATTILQKNWTPFEWRGQLFLSYAIQPHEILLADLTTGYCHPVFETSSYVGWNYGPLRGSSPAQLVDGEYLSFFHSSCYVASPVTRGEKAWHYFFGAFTFSEAPPFHLTSISPYPIITKGLYTYLIYWKRVIFPGSYVVSGDTIYLAYGKDDWEIWIATIDKGALYKSLQPVYSIDDTIFE